MVKKEKNYFMSGGISIANNFIFLTHTTHMRNVRNDRYAYGMR